MNDKKPVSPVGKLFALLIAVVIIIAAGELFLRLFAPFPDYTAMTIRSFPDQYDPLLGYAGIPRLDKWFILPDFKHKIVNNSRGYRDKERLYEKGGKKRIVVLGDSTAWGWGVEAKDRFSDIMERRLKGWEVINLAHPGYSTDQELLVLQTEGFKYHPDIVILLFDKNDVVEGNNAKVIDVIQPKPYFEEEGGRLVLKNTPVPRDLVYWAQKRMLADLYGAPEVEAASFWSWDYLKRRVLTKSQLYNWIVFRIEHPIWLSSTEGEPKLSVERMKENMALTEKILEEMNKECRENDARLVVAAIPSAYSTLLSGFCRRKGILHIDLSQALNGRLRPVSYRRVGHWTPYGHRLAAGAIIKYLKANGLTR